MGDWIVNRNRYGESRSVGLSLLVESREFAKLSAEPNLWRAKNRERVLPFRIAAWFAIEAWTLGTLMIRPSGQKTRSKDLIVGNLEFLQPDVPNLARRNIFVG